MKEVKPSFFYIAHNVLLTPLPFQLYFPPPPSPQFLSFSLLHLHLLIYSIYISAPLRSTTWIEKPLGLFWLFWPSTADITIHFTTSYIQICGVRTRTELSNSLHRILSERRPENLPEKNLSKEKNSAGNLSRIHGSCSEKPILRRLHGWKDFALIYKTSIPTKDGKL